MIEKEVVSSQIKKIGYDEEKKELFVTFHKGSTYKYSNVPMDLYLSLMSADSIGSYFIKNIKGKTSYPFVLIS